MPTTRPRHVITETDDVARALDEAARVWPEDRGNRRVLLLHLVREGLDAVTDRRQALLEDRRAAIQETAGALTGIYEPGYLERLRRDWPS